MLLTELLEQIKTSPDTIVFNDVLYVITANYNYTPARFTNGNGDDQVVSDAGKNEGSCKIFAFAKLHCLNEAQTLACFGHYYRNDVLKHPGGADHANSRSFMRHGWSGIHFDQFPLSAK
jgi:hypothetical protein